MVFKSYMKQALDQARAAAERGEVPVGAVVISPQGRIVAAEGNRTREFNDPTAHAEMLAIRAACAALGSERLTGHDLYVTLEPWCDVRRRYRRGPHRTRLLWRIRPEIRGRSLWCAGVFAPASASQARSL